MKEGGALWRQHAAGCATVVEQPYAACNRASATTPRGLFTRRSAQSAAENAHTSVERPARHPSEAQMSLKTNATQQKKDQSSTK